MYSDKENVNILTALLADHGICHAVVCPGSRNAPIVHNLNEHPHITCYAVTDERSAGFYALGMSLSLRQPVAVCVTSGTALLNLAPAVAEAYYQQVPLVVVSADRPQQWIDQLDGQTLPQGDALGRFVRKAVTLPEYKPQPDSTGKENRSEEERWYCNRLVNEALLSLTHGPVHINVPISQPLFGFTTARLPKVRTVRLQHFPADDVAVEALSTFLQSSRPMLLIGQTMLTACQREYLEDIRQRIVVLHESLAGVEKQGAVHFDEALPLIKDRTADYMPDCILYLGGTFVSKRLKAFLRSGHCYGIRVSADEHFADTFMNTDILLQSSGETVLRRIARACRDGRYEDCHDDYLPLGASTDFHSRWTALIEQAARHAESHEPPYSQMAAVKAFEQQLPQIIKDPHAVAVHYANSQSIRLANIYARRQVYCNRGVNGIEGSLSTAAGFSCVTGQRVFCVIGDLSFFYDQNALWNQNLRGNLRILLLNNGKGGIFNMLKGLEQSPARDRYVAAAHQTTAEGICQQNHVGYRQAADMQQMQESIHWLIQTESEHPLLLEVLTNADEDEHAVAGYYHSLSI